MLCTIHRHNSNVSFRYTNCLKWALQHFLNLDNSREHLRNRLCLHMRLRTHNLTQMGCLPFPSNFWSPRHLSYSYPTANIATGWMFLDIKTKQRPWQKQKQRNIVADSAVVPSGCKEMTPLWRIVDITNNWKQCYNKSRMQRRYFRALCYFVERRFDYTTASEMGGTAEGHTMWSCGHTDTKAQHNEGQSMVDIVPFEHGTQIFCIWHTL